MKLSRLHPSLLITLTVGILAAAFVLGDRAGQQLFDAGEAMPAAAMVAMPTAAIAENYLPQALPTSDSQENTLFILLGSSESNISPTVWHISDLPGSPIFMHLIVPSARFGEAFDQAFYQLNLQPMITGKDRRAIEALFEQQGLSWNRIVIMDISMFGETLTALNEAAMGQFSIDQNQILTQLPRQQMDDRSRAQTINDQVSLWNGLCSLFLNTSAEHAGARNLFRPHSAYPVCVVSDDLH